jgi:hypothetical protein
MFETITLFENKAVDAAYQENKMGKFEVTLIASCEKMRADSSGLARLFMFLTKTKETRKFSAKRIFSS